MSMDARPCTLKQANELVDELHRHHDPVVGHRFSIAAYHNGRLCGVAIVGRPVGRGVDQYSECEVTRLVTDGTNNACSFLYSRAARAARAIGFVQIRTYTMVSEPGTSLIASGWICDGVVRANGKGWGSRTNRKDDEKLHVAKTRWRKVLNCALTEGE